MASAVQRVEMPVAGVHVARVTSDEMYVGMKDWFGIARIEAGRSEFWMSGRAWSGRPHSIIIQQPGDVHRDLERDGSITYQIVRLQASLVEHVIGRVHHLSAVLAANDERSTAFQHLHDAINANADRFTLECLVAEAIGALEDIGDPPLLHSRPVRRALSMMRERMAEPMTLDEVAATAGLDKFHLCRAFRAQVGIPPHAYLTQLRILHAKQLLAAGAKPKDVAPIVGLYDQSQLNRHFRRIVGMTPGQFARSR